MDNFLTGLTSAIGNAAQGVGNFFSQQFSPAVQRFSQQAIQGLSQPPQNLDIGKTTPINFGQVAQNVTNYFNPNDVGSADNPNPNFWSTPMAKVLAGQQPVPKFNFAEQIGQQANQAVGGGIPGQVAGFGASLIPGIAEGIMNVPSEMGQFAVDAGNAVDSGTPLVQFSPISNPIGIGAGGFQLTPKGVGLAAEFANPLLTIATLGKAPEILGTLKEGSWGISALKGLMNGVGYGGVFGGLQGLQDNQNAPDVQTQIAKALPSVGMGMLSGGILGTVLGPVGKQFFGNKTPGDSAALAENGLVPPEAMTDAYKILGVKPDATLPEIRSAYTQALSEFHPNNGGTPEAVDALNNAYEMTTRNTAPLVTFDQNGNPNVQFSDEFGGNTLTPKQVAQARKAATDNTAFQARLANLKAGKLPLKSPLPGQPSEDQFLQYGSDLLTPEGQQAITAKTQQALNNQPAFHDVLDSVAEKNQGRTVSNVKSPDSMATKIVANRINGEPNYGLQDVKDGLRGTIIVKDQQAVNKAIADLQDELQARGLQRQGEGQNYFKNPQPSGYEGYHLNVGMPDGTIGEIQIHTPQSYANAQVTHGVYNAFDSETSDKINTQLKQLRNQLRTDPVAKIEQMTQQAEGKNFQNVLSPLTSDFRGGQIPLTPQGEIATRLQEQNPSLDYGFLQEPEQAAQNAKRLQNESIQNHYLNNLVRIKNGLETKLQTTQQTTSPEIEGMMKMRGQLQNEIDNAKAFIQQNRNNPAVGRTIATPKEMTAHIKDLQTSMKNIDAQVKDMQSKLKVRNDQQTTGLKAQLEDLNKQIDQEQSKGRIQNSIKLAQTPVEKPAVVKVAPAEKTPAQITFEQTKVPASAQLETSQTAPVAPTTAHSNETRVLSFSPVEGGQAQVGTPAELGLTLSSKADNVWEDQQGRQYSAQYDPQAEKTYKQQAGLPTLRSADEVMQNTKGKVQLGKPTRNAAMNAVNYGGVPMSLALERSPNTSARIAGFGVLDAQRTESFLANKWTTTLENAEKGLTPEEISNGTKVVEGLEQPMSAKAANYAKAIQEVTGEADALAKKAGVMTRNEDGTQQPYQTMPNYYPRTYTQAQYDAMAEAAKTPEEALTLRRKGQLFTNRFGNMEQHRGEGMEGVEQRRDAQVMHEYAQSAAHKIATTSVFGANSDKAANLIQGMIASGDTADANTFKKVLEVNGIAQGPNDTADPTEKLMGNAVKAVRAGIDFTNLGGVTGVHHLTVEPSLIGQYGFKNAVKSLPDFGKAFIGKPSEFARENVTRLHQEPANGAVSGAIGKFYKVIQLDRVLNAFSAQTAKAADLTVSDMEKNLADPRVRTNIIQAHLPYDEIVQRGSFTPEQRHAYIQAGLQNAGLLFNPDDIPKLAINPIGKAIMALSGPITARTQRMIPLLAHQIQDNANLAPAMKWGLSAMLLGTVSRIASNLIQNHPQQSPQQLLTEGALSGMGINYGPINTTSVANMIQYPEYAAPTAAGMIGGPLASMGVNGLQAYQNITSGNPSNQTTGLREATRYLPIVGPTVSNTLFPAKSWVGNRPSDLVKILATGNKPNWEQAGLVQHSPLDLVRANPQVNRYQQVVNQGYSQAQKSLSSGEQSQMQQMSTLEAKGDLQSISQAQQIMANDPKIFAAKSIEEKAQAAAQNRSVDPLYMLSPQQGTAYLKYQNMSFADKGAYAYSHPDVVATARARDAYYQSASYKSYQQDLQHSIANYKGYTPIHNPVYDTFPSGKLSLPTAFGNVPYDGNQAIADYKYYQTMSSTDSKKAEFAANHPWVEDAKIAEAGYNQQILQQEWNQRPSGQTLQQFVDAHTLKNSDGTQTTPNIAGVDDNGQIVPAYNPIGDPIYQVSPQLRSASLAYTAMSKTGNTAGKQQILSMYPQLPQLWQARSAYYQANPIAVAGTSTGGLNLPFGTGTGSSSGSSSSSSSNYMDNVVKREEIYGVLRDTVPQGHPIRLGGMQSARGQADVKALQQNPIANYLAQIRAYPQAVFNAPKPAMPQLTTKPVLKVPTVQPVKLNFNPSPQVPFLLNESVQPAPTTRSLSY